jgi:hypothetical protein
MHQSIATGVALALVALGAGAAEPVASTVPAKAVATVATKAAGADKAATTALPAKAGSPGGDVTMSGMSIVGNDEAPKSLVIVPWKSSQLGDTPGISRLLDDSTQPVDREVFMRELSYYEIKTGSK